MRSRGQGVRNIPILQPGIDAMAVLKCEIDRATESRSDRTGATYATPAGYTRRRCFWCLRRSIRNSAGSRRSSQATPAGHRTRRMSDMLRCDRHAEVVQVTFDAHEWDTEVLEAAIHDPPHQTGRGTTTAPSTARRSSGTTRRSATALAMRGTHRGRAFDDPIDRGGAARPVLSGDAYHQDYYRRHAAQPYCLCHLACWRSSEAVREPDPFVVEPPWPA